MSGPRCRRIAWTRNRIVQISDGADSSARTADGVSAATAELKRVESAIQAALAQFRLYWAFGARSQRGTNRTEDLGNSRVKRTQMPSGHWRATMAWVR